MTPINTPQPGFTIRFAEKQDAELITDYIRALAAFEDELKFVSVTPELLEHNVFEAKHAEVLIGEFEGKPVGFALFHATFSTFLGKPGIGLVDLYIEPHVRGRGFGKAMLAYLAKLTVERNCGRLEWWCHDWNAHAIKLYKGWGAYPIDNIRVYRLCDQALLDFAKTIE